jgi:hypothetical protein
MMARPFVPIASVNLTFLWQPGSGMRAASDALSGEGHAGNVGWTQQLGKGTGRIGIPQMVATKDSDAALAHLSTLFST